MVNELQQEAYRKLYPRDSQRICTAYSYFARYLSGCIYDRFGILDAVSQPFRLPQYIKKDVIEASLERARQLGPCAVAWSGGVDSSFLLACFIHEGLDFTVCYNNVADDTAPGLLEWLRKHKVRLKRCGVLRNFTTQGRIVTGDVVDTLLFPSKSGMQNHALPEGNIRQALISRYGEAEGQRLIGVLEDYAVKLGKPARSDEDIVRLMSWGCLYYAHREAFYHMVRGCKDMIPFFDTQLFTDISWSQYWNSRGWTDNKKVFRKFLQEIFGEVALEIEVSRSKYYRAVRDVRFIY